MAYQSMRLKDLIDSGAENYLFNQDTGAAYKFDSAQPSGPALDYSQAPVDIAGYGKGYRIKGDPLSAVLTDGRIIRMGEDTGAARKRMMEDIALQKAQQGLAEGDTDNKLKMAQLAELTGDYSQMGGMPSGAQSQPIPQGVNVAEYRKEMAKIAAKEMSARIPGTQEYKRIQDEGRKANSILNDATNTRKYSRDTADALEKNLADLMGVPVSELPKILSNESAAKSRLSPAVGSIDARTPTFFQNTTNIESNIDALKNKAQMFGITNLRKSGVAPGTVTEREWPKFEAMLGNIDPRLGEAEFVKQLRDIYAQVRSARESGEVDYQQLTSGLPPSMLGQSGNAAPTQPINSKNLPSSVDGWTLKTDKNGRKAYVSPDGKQFKEVP